MERRRLRDHAALFFALVRASEELNKRFRYMQLGSAPASASTTIMPMPTDALAETQILPTGF